MPQVSGRARRDFRASFALDGVVAQSLLEPGKGALGAGTDVAREARVVLALEDAAAGVADEASVDADHGVGGDPRQVGRSGGLLLRLSTAEHCENAAFDARARLPRVGRQPVQRNRPSVSESAEHPGVDVRLTGDGRCVAKRSSDRL